MTANQIDMPQLARDFAANLGRTGVTLDFSPASLAVIDRLIPAMRQQYRRPVIRRAGRSEARHALTWPHTSLQRA